jgi:protein-tyrosine phosphatase
MFDFHNHLMPGVDDGAANIDESRSGLATMLEQGVTTIVTTPHIRASLTDWPRELESYLGQLDEAFAALERLSQAEFPAVRLERGVEIMLDVPSPSLTDPRLRLAGTRFALVEFPFMNVPPNSTMPIRSVVGQGVTPIIAHPERYANMGSNVELIDAWREAGALIQVNCGSLVGQYGATARRLSWQILESGWAQYLSSDYHSKGRCTIQQCSAAMLERGGAAQLRALTVTNPERMLSSEDPIDVDPLEPIQLGFWRKIFGQ